MSNKKKTPKPTRPRSGAQASQDFESFHSAVNRIPAPRDENANKISDGELSAFIGDSTPPPLDRMHGDSYSGWLDLQISTRTPVVFGDQHDNNVSLPRDADGCVALPPTMIKGMVSRAYEVFTASRFRVFDGHDESLTYRADPAMANQLIAGRITKDTDGHLALELLRGRGGNDGIGLIRDDPMKGLGTLVLEGHPITLGPGKKAPNEQQVWTRFRNLLKHGRKVGVRLTPCDGSYLVTHVYDLQTKKFEKFFSLTPEEDAKSFPAIGYVCRTAQEAHDNRPPSRALYADKHYERFFFSVSDSGKFSPERRTLSSSVLNAYERVITSYRAEHAAQEGKSSQHALNRASSDPDHVAARDGDLVFVRLDKGGEVAEILPTMVGRRSYDRSPRELAAVQGVLPPAKATEASPADRLFGYVIDPPEDGAAGGDVAARGRLFFGTVDTSEVTVSSQAKRLVPLLSPKPSSARRFLTDVKPRPEGEKPRRSDYFKAGQRLGAAAYPVHRTALDEPFPTEATTVMVETPGDENAATRLIAKDWIETGSVMRTCLRFEGLSEHELAALLWVLTPENLVPEDKRGPAPVGEKAPVGYLRMGLGKPLGLGVVEVRATEVRSINSSDLTSGYVSLSGALGTAEKIHRISDFRLPFKPEALPWVKAMQRASYGYDDDIPVRYMSLEENKGNNQTDSTTGEPCRGKGVSPQDMFGDDSGKPIIVTPAQQGGGRRPRGKQQHGFRR